MRIDKTMQNAYDGICDFELVIGMLNFISHEDYILCNGGKHVRCQ